MTHSTLNTDLKYLHALVNNVTKYTDHFKPICLSVWTVFCCLSSCRFSFTLFRPRTYGK